MQANRTKRRLASVLCALCVVLVFISMFSIPAYAALTDTNIGATVSGSTDSNSISGTTVSVSRFGWGNDKYTITLTNNSGSDAVLSFVYKVTTGGRGGSATVVYHANSTAGATSVTLSSGATFKQTLGAGGKVVISTETAKMGSVAVELTDISLKIKTSANVTFVPDAAVSYSVGYMDGNGSAQTAAVTAGGSNVTVNAELSEGVSITPTTEGYVCESATGTIGGTIYADVGGKFTVAKNETVTPVFISSSSVKPFTHLGNGNAYYTLGAAVNAGSGTVVLNQNHTLPAGDYIIPSGVTLLIPFDTGNTLVTNGTDNLVDSYNADAIARSEFRQLTLATGAKIKVASGGAISISSSRANQFIGQVGPYGAIYMESGSNITVQSGGTLYAWGYIFHGTNGSGTVTVESGGTVYEPISIMDYPGSTSLTTTLTDAKVFPMRTYALRNVEVPMTLKSGAKEYAFSCLYGSNPLVGTNPLYILVVANTNINSETPVFQNTGTITKSYENSRMRMVVNGNFTLNSMTVEVSKSIGTVKISSSDTSGFYLPGCYDMIIGSGTTTLNDNVIMSEGATLTINSGAVLNTNSKNVYILDADEDPGTVSTSNGCGIDVQDVHGKYYTNVPRDAVLDVNGTLKASGGFYTSTSGASITSSQGGGVIEVSGTSTSTSVAVKNTNAHTSVNITPAKLKNADGKYIQSGTNTYTYDSTVGKWICQTHSGVDTDHTCDVCGFVTECVDANSDSTCDICGASLCNHTNTTKIAEVAPTCTETGLTAGLKCSDCGTVTVAQEEIPATGHQNTSTTTVDATCTVDGSVTVTCDDCKATVSTEVIPQTGHSYNAVVTAPTCTDDGYTTYTCACGDSYTADAVAATGHSYTSEVTQAATCAAKGVTTYTCSVCSDSYTEEIDKIPHSYDTGTVTTSPSCTATGVMTYECINCDHSYTAEIAVTDHTPGDAATCTEAQTCTVCGAEIDPALGHNAVTDAAKAATCTATGLTEGSHCDRCDEVLVAQTVVAATGHSYEAVVTAPTCTEEGFTTYTCSVCPDTYIADKVAATGHNYTSTVTAPTCTEQGYTTYTCSACGDSYTDNFVDATGHSYEAVVTQPTCTEQGYTTYTCTCGHTYNDNYVAKAEHAWNNGEVTTAPDCDSEGVMTYTCTVCSETKTETIAATGHSWNEGVETTAPDCDSEGVMTCTCTKCGETKTEAISATGHTPEDVARVDPTCTQPGQEAGQKCSVCDAVLSGMAEIPATGHSYESVVTPPKCTEQGYTTYTCSACGDSYVADYVDATGHSYTSKVTDPTCTEGGYTTYTCSVCSDTYTGDVVAAVGHSYVEEVTKPTCEGQGYTTHTCSVCGDSYVDTYVDPIGHHYTDYVSDENASCTEDGTKTAECDNGCGQSDTVTETGSATGHKYEKNIASDVLAQAATCTTPAMYYIKCDVCGTPHEQQTVAYGNPNGHDYVGHEAKVPSCIEIGWNAYQTCNNCDYTSYVEIAALGHTDGDVVVENEVAADCVTGGSYDNVTYCTVCGVETSRETIEVPATGHTAGDVVVKNEVAADCVNDGTYDNVVYCTICEAELSRETITVDALGHTEGEIVVENNVAPDCVNAGSYDNVVYCTVCNAELSRNTVTVEKIDHDYEAVVTAPTCTEKGYTTYTCSACGDSYVADETAAAGHSYSESITTAATCTTPGVKTFTCTCGESYTEEIAATGHENTTTTTVDATCVQDGSVTVACDDCGATLSTETIPATGEHSYGEDGKCTVCGAEEPIEEEHAAQIGTEKYVTLAEAIQAAVSGDTIVLLADVTEKPDAILAGGVNIDLNGKQLWNANIDTALNSIVHRGPITVKAEGGYEVIPVEGDLWTVKAVFTDYISAGLQLEAEVKLQINFRPTDRNAVDPSRLGVLIWPAEQYPGDEAVDVDTCNAAYVLRGAVWSNSNGGRFEIATGGIPAKEWGDAVAFVPFYVRDDGTYVYGRVIRNYSPRTYCYNKLKDADTRDDALMIAILNYGATAQRKFNYRTDDLMNSGLTAAQQALTWNASLVRSDWDVPVAKAGALVRNTSVVTGRGGGLELLGAIDTRYYIHVASSVSVKEVKILVWTEADYDSLDILTAENASFVETMSYVRAESKGNRYEYSYTGLAAKNIFTKIYTCAVVTDTDGNTYYGGVLGYSPERYIYINASKSTIDGELAKRLGIYGDAARTYFSLIN